MIASRQTKSNRFGAVGAAVLVALLFSVGAPSEAIAQDVAVVAHPGVPVDDLEFNEMRRILLGDRQFWPSDIRITLLIRAPVAHERDIILNTIYDMSESQFQQYWISKVFRAEVASGPKIVYSNDMVVALAAGIPGAVSFVAAEQIPAGLKVLRIDGLLPGDEGYPLR